MRTPHRTALALSALALAGALTACGEADDAGTVPPPGGVTDPGEGGIGGEIDDGGAGTEVEED